MTILITKGTFGWFNGRKIKMLSAASGPVTLDPGLEYRLVHQDKIAKYIKGTEPLEADVVECDVTQKVVLENGDECYEVKERETGEVGYVKPLEGMSFAELGEELEALGVDEETINKLRSKASRVSKIQQIHDEMAGASADPIPSFEPEGLI